MWILVGLIALAFSPLPYWIICIIVAVGTLVFTLLVLLLARPYVCQNCSAIVALDDLLEYNNSLNSTPPASQAPSDAPNRRAG